MKKDLNTLTRELGECIEGTGKVLQREAPPISVMEIELATQTLEACLSTLDSLRLAKLGVEVKGFCNPN